ncbi:peptidylprolyl isomerase [Clostridium chrysemydis]|uniref:peptidylprolyl isomerase n=1 Tax=Clostridium chrysemydis TaxID=2665504 RepID=UPI00188427EA
MGKIKKIIALGLLAITGFAFVGCDMIQKTPEAIQNEKLAVVGDKTITRGDLDKVMQPTFDQLKQQYGEDYMKNDQIKENVIKQEKSQLTALVDSAVMLQEATKLNLVPNEETMKKEMDDRMKFFEQLYGSKENLESEIKKAGYKDMDAFKAFVKDQIIVGKVMEYIVKDVKITDADAQKYYDEHKSEYEMQPGANVYHILVKDEKAAKEIKSKLDGGAKFADLAKQYGTDGTKEQGGSLGYIPYDSKDYDQDFMNAVKKLKKDGEISGPVKTQFGYHIIMVDNINTKKTVTPFKDVKDEIKKTLMSQAQQAKYDEFMKKWKEELKVKVYEDKIGK